MNEFKEIIEFLELSDFFTIRSGKFEHEENKKGEIIRLTETPTSRIASEADFEDLFLTQIDKRNVFPEAVEAFRIILAEEINNLITREKRKENKFKNVNLIALSEQFIEWLQNGENFNFSDGSDVKLIDSIALLRRAGIINFLIETNAKTNPHNIAKLIKKVLNTDKSVFTISQYLTTNLEDKKHPFRDIQRISEIDKILNDFKITNKSEN